VADDGEAVGGAGRRSLAAVSPIEWPVRCSLLVRELLLFGRVRAARRAPDEVDEADDGCPGQHSEEEHEMGYRPLNLGQSGQQALPDRELSGHRSPFSGDIATEGGECPGGAERRGIEGE